MFNLERPYYVNTVNLQLPYPIHDTKVLIQYALF